jgi:hypothetical protein
MTIPNYDDLFNPLLNEFYSLGGSASVSEKELEVAAILNLSDKNIPTIHCDNRTKLSNNEANSSAYSHT